MNKFLLMVICVLICGKPELQSAENDQKTSPNLIYQDSSFETSLDFFNYDATTGLPCHVFQAIPEIDRTNAIDGTSSLCWKTNGAGELLKGRIMQTVPGKRYTFSVYVKTDTDGILLKLRLVSPEWKDHLVFPEMVLRRQWSRYQFTFTAKEDSYWAGFVFDGKSMIWVDACQLEEGETPSSYVNSGRLNIGIYIPSQNNHVFFPGEQIAVNYSIEKTRKDINFEGLTVSFKITDYNGHTVYESNKDLSFFQQRLFSETYKMRNMKDSPVLGHYTVRAQLKNQKGDLVANAISAFVIVNPPVDIEKGMAPFCGLCGFLFPGVKRIGVRWAHVGFKWDAVEPSENKYNWEWINMIKPLKKEGFKTILTIAHLPSAPKWAWDPQEVRECQEKRITIPQSGFLPANKHLKNWQKLFQLVATKFDKFVDIYEIGAEDDLTLGRNPYYRQKYSDTVARTFVRGAATDRLAEMIKLAAREIRDINPQAKIGAIRPSGGDCTDEKPRFTFSRAVFEKAGKEFDMFPLDPYGGCRYIGPFAKQVTMPEDFLLDDLKEALALGRDIGNNQHVFISEFGYGIDFAATPDSIYSRKLVDKLARTYLLARATKNVDLCFWFMSLGFFRESERYEYGLWREYPLATVSAYSMVARIVENVREAQSFKMGDNCWAVAFRKNNLASGAIWLVRGRGSVKIKLPAMFQILDVMGNPIMTNRDEDFILEIGETPVYFEGKGDDAFDILKQSLSSAIPSCVPVDVAFNTPSIEKGILKIHNQLNKKISVAINVNKNKNALFERIMELGPKKTESVNILIENKETIDVNVRNPKTLSGENLQISYPIDLRACKKLSIPVTIDGNVKEWNAMPYIQLDKRGQILPPDPQIPWKGPDDLSMKFYMAWDQQYFYFAAEVTDDMHFNSQSGDAIWNGDAIQMAFDPEGVHDTSISGYRPLTSEICLALTRKGIEARRYSGDSMTAEKGQFTVVRNEKDKKTNYEGKIPLAALKITPKPGCVFGFNFVLFEDDDGAGKTHWFQNSPGITNGRCAALFQKFYLSE